jgi:NADPH:quinone reductase-like Zn-dependent oxidoreductase
MVDEGKLKVKISHRFPMTEEGVRDAFMEQQSRRTVGKIVIDIVPL